MREIKFRIWDKQNKQMMNPREPDDEGELVICLNGKIYKHWFIDAGYGDGAGGGLAEVNEDIKQYILMQYTGLKDQKGKEIYEGDIVKGFLDERFIVRYGEGTFDSGFYRYTGFYLEIIKYMMYPKGEQGEDNYNINEKDVKCLEVIGNIYENPEMIK